MTYLYALILLLCFLAFAVVVFVALIFFIRYPDIGITVGIAFVSGIFYLAAVDIVREARGEKEP